MTIIFVDKFYEPFNKIYLKKLLGTIPNAIEQHNVN